MKNTLTDSTLKKLTNYLFASGASINVLVGINAIYLGNYFLLSICLLLAFCNCVGYILSISDKPRLGLNVMLCSYILVFSYSSFTELVIYPLMLVFPVIIGLVNLFHSQWKIRCFYIISCLIGCIICIINTNIYIFGEVDFHQIFNSVLIGTGLVFGILVITELHGKIMANYQSELEDNKERILDSNIELKKYIKSNLQLENFAYLASHQLKTPIKNISSFNQLLERKLIGKLDLKEKELFEMVKLETWRMNSMMSDLLKLSQLSKKKISFSRIQGADFINKFIDKQFRDEKNQIEFNDFPSELFAEESQLSLLFLNLIDNGLKFNRSKETPKVIIDCIENRNEYLFRVKDRGIGIADDYKQKVFLIFNKLSVREGFKNSGVGLSMCKEIVDKHNGKIWIEDNPAGGTIVNFTISKALGISKSFGKGESKSFLEVVNRSA